MPVPLTFSSTCCNNYRIKGESWHYFFFNCEKYNDGNPSEKVIKVLFKTNNSFNSTIMASFLPVIGPSEQKKQRKMSFIAV